MAHFAQLDKNNIVLAINVIANSDCLDSDGNESESVGITFCKSLWGADTNWKQTSYNGNFRKQYAEVGGEYDPNNNIFIAPRPIDFNGVLCESWTLNSITHEWDCPQPFPDDARPGVDFDGNLIPGGAISYDWDETVYQSDSDSGGRPNGWVRI